MKKNNNEKKLVVKKANQLIEARYKLDKNEQKLILAVVSMINEGDEDFLEYTLSVQNFVNLMDVKGKGYYSEVKQKAELLLKKPLIIECSDGSDLICNWFSSIKYLRKKGHVIFRFDPNLKPYLLCLKEKYKRYNINNILKFKSGYSIRLYELLKQYENIGKRHIIIKDLRKMLGIEDEKYKFYKDFKKYVVFVAQKELEKKTDIKFTFEEKKLTRKVDSVIFYIEKNVKEEPKSKLKPLPLVERSEYCISDEMDRLCLAIEEKLKLEPKNRFKPKVFAFKNLKNRKHPKAIVLALNRLNDYWEIAKESPWGYGQHVLDIESGNYHEQDTIAAHEALKKELLPDWFEADGF